ncbi:MAG: ERCC4 domain-containing protein [Promethearchaeota archaeon]
MEGSRRGGRIVIDSGERDYVKEVFDKLKIPYLVQEIIIEIPCEKKSVCNEDCKYCEYNIRERVGDFSNEARSFIIERKRVDDFYASMADGRLYEQARKMYELFDGPKIIILEGMPDSHFFTDSHQFRSFIFREKDFATKSPIQQVVAMHPEHKKWIYSTIGELASLGIFIIQTWNLEETAIFVDEINKGSGSEPRIRYVPRRISGLSIEENMLCQIKGIGQKKARQLMEKYGSLSNLIRDLRKMKKSEIESKSLLKKLHEVFIE